MANEKRGVFVVFEHLHGGLTRMGNHRFACEAFPPSPGEVEDMQRTLTEVMKKVDAVIVDWKDMGPIPAEKVVPPQQ